MWAWSGLGMWDPRYAAENIADLLEAHWGSGEVDQWFEVSMGFLVEGSVVEVGRQGGLCMAYRLHDR